MKYMLLIYGNQELWDSFPPEDMERIIRETGALQAELRASGEFVGAWGVADQVQAKTVHLDSGVPVVTDGPYIEAKEYLGSFDIIDVDSDSMFEWPWLYAVEVGRWSLSDAQARRLRTYLDRGGFLMVDDFWGEDEWDNFYQNIKRVFPDREPQCRHARSQAKVISHTA